MCNLRTIEEFHNIFGPELKAVTGDPERIDTVIQRVDRLVVDIETIKFDPFNPSNKSDNIATIVWNVIFTDTA